MDICWISCQVMADMKKVYDDLIIINLYVCQTNLIREIIFEKYKDSEFVLGSCRFWTWM